MQLTDLQLHIHANHPLLKLGANGITWSYGNPEKDHFQVVYHTPTGYVEIRRYIRGSIEYYMTFASQTPLHLISQVINFLTEAIR